MTSNCCTLDLSIDEPQMLSLSLGESYHGPYVLPTMSADTKGGAKLGSGLEIDSDVLSIDLTDNATGESITAADASYLASLTVDGKAVQDGTPTPSAPVDVQVVKSPNLLDTISAFTKATTTYGGCTLTNNGNGTFTLSGTNMAGASWGFNSNSGSLVLKPGTYTLLGDESLSGSFITAAIGGTQMHGTFTLAEEKTLTQWRVFVNANATISGTCCPTLVNGSTGVAIPFGSIGLKVGSTITPIDLQGNVLASLPDGAKDVLMIDSTGAVTLEKNVGVAVIDGVTVKCNSKSDYGNNVRANIALPGQLNVSSSKRLNCYNDMFRISAEPVNTPALDGSAYSYELYTSFSFAIIPSSVLASTDIADINAWFAANPTTVVYPLATPQTIDLGTIDMPAIPLDAQISVTAAVTPTISASWWARGAAAIAEALKSLRDGLLARIEAIETAIADL